MTLEELNLELKKLVGEEVSLKVIALRSLGLYFCGQPHDHNNVSFLIHPPWRYEQQGEVIVGSGDIYFAAANSTPEEQKAHESKLDGIRSLTGALEGARLVDCRVDLVTSDLILEFSGDQVVRNFADSAFDETAWIYRKPRRNLAASVSPSGIRLETKKEGI